ncbi:MAG: zf-HC2 domain-containing protein [Calditrichia bacterium]|nr:zf-HC2 domain-containing protein [Calditrichia bacterium]
MKHEKVIEDLVSWMEGKITREQRQAIDQHLQECPDCQHYYQVMQDVLENPDTAGLPHLEADPYLSTRIQSGEARTAISTKKVPLFDGLRWSFVTLLLFIGMSLGAFMGYSLFQPENGNDSGIVTAYYQAFNQGENVFQLDEILYLENGEAK